MPPFDPSKTNNQAVTAQIFYWIGLWLVAFDGVWLMFHLALGSTDGLHGLLKSVIAHTIYGAIGTIICFSPLVVRAKDTPKLFGSTLFWAVYWTFLLALYLLQPITECHNPLGSDACQQMRVLILIVAIPASLIYCGTIGSLGFVFYQMLFSEKKTDD